MSDASSSILPPPLQRALPSARNVAAAYLGTVVEAGVAKQPEGRADDVTLWLKELGDKVFYGG